MDTAFIYLDTNILKFGAYRKLRYLPRLQRVKWGGFESTVPVFSRKEVDTRERIKDAKLRREIGYIGLISDAGKSGRARYFMNSETILESWQIPAMDTVDLFFNASIEDAPAPIKYGRIISGSGVNAKQAQVDFIAGLTDPRLAQLRKWTGANQGRTVHRNQLLDAFHVWCAEYNGCAYFLTLDLKLIKSLKAHVAELGTLPIVPSRLAETLGLVHPDFDPLA